jgi:type II secretory pathway predicted ATPase ExeA
METCATGRNSIMYEDFYGLKTDPFRLTSDHRFSFSHASYSRARASVQYALLRAEGFVMITGGPGTGKTTLIHDLMADLPRNEFIVGYLASTQLGADDLLRMTAHAFGMESAAPKKAQILMRLMEFLAQQYRLGLHALLIIDDAQDLAPAAMEELRLLNNLQQGGQQLLQIVLLGQEELRLLLRRPEMEQVHQRLVAAWHLEPLSPEETVGYVRHRLETAGWTGDPVIEPGVLPIVHAFSKGIPRRINLICSRLLLHGFMQQSHSITQADAETVAHNLGDEELTHREHERDEPSSSPEEGLRAAATRGPARIRREGARRGGGNAEDRCGNLVAGRSRSLPYRRAGTAIRFQQDGTVGGDRWAGQKGSCRGKGCRKRARPATADRAPQASGKGCARSRATQGAANSIARGVGNGPQGAGRQAQARARARARVSARAPAPARQAARGPTGRRRPGRGNSPDHCQPRSAYLRRAGMGRARSRHARWRAGAGCARSAQVFAFPARDPGSAAVFPGDARHPLRFASGPVAGRNGSGAIPD